MRQILCCLLFLSALPVYAQVDLSANNFLALPDGHDITLKDGFVKKIKIGNEEYAVSCSGWEGLHPDTGIEDGAFRLSATAEQPANHICQVITFDPPIKMPIFLAAKCQSNTTRLDDYCALYLDVIYDDGTPLWGQLVGFPKGQYDFRCGEFNFQPEKPIREIRAYLLIRKAEGVVWFKDIFIGPTPLLPIRFQAIGGLFGPGSAAVYARQSWYDPEIAMQLALNTIDGNEIASCFSAQIPLLVHAGSPIDALPAIVACSVNRKGETALVTKLIDTTPCDNGRGYCVWTTTSMERVYPYSLPRVASDDGTQIVPLEQTVRENAALREKLKSPSAHIELAQNEYESFQVAVLSPIALENVKVSFSDLVLGDNPEIKISSQNLDWKQVGFVRAEKIRNHRYDTEGIPGWWPDPLLPVECFSLAECRTQPVWVTLYAPKGTTPGTYHGTMTIVPNGAPKTEIALTVTVWDFELPDEGHFKTAFALMDGFLESVYQQRPTTPELRKRYGDFLLQHRLTPEGDISRTRTPVLDELEHYRGRGLGAFNILNMVEDRGNSTWVCNSPPEFYTPEFKEKMFRMLKPYIEELRRRNLSKQAYIYTFDERGDEYKEIMTEFFGMIKEHFPEVSTLTTSHFPTDPELMKTMHIDWMCPLTSSYDYETAEKCRAAGQQVWAYICCGPDYPYMNIMCRFPLIESREIFWQAYQEQFDGLLYWGLNIWGLANNVPIDPANGPFLDWSIESYIGGHIYGDGRLIYAGMNGQPIGSIRLANLRDGLEDYEYLHKVREKTDSLQNARDLAQPLVPQLTEFNRNPQTLYKQRRKLVEAISE